MLTRLEVDGFKSLQGFALDLEPLTVLLGPNSGGKSVVLESLALLNRLRSMSPLDALAGGRGLVIDQFSRDGAGIAPEIRISAEYLTPMDPCSRWRREISFTRHPLSSGGERIKSNDGLLSLLTTDDPWARAHPQYEHLIRQPASKIEMLDFSGEFDLHFTSLQLHLHAPDLRDPCDRLGDPILKPDASNLAAALAALEPAALEQVRTALAATVPGVASLEVVAERELLRVEFILSDGERLPARLASDGTLRVLALLTAAHMQGGPPTICIEEPEDGIHPRGLRALLALLHARSRIREHGRLPPQLVLTSHSPVVLQALQAAPECVRYVDVVHQGGRRCSRIRTVSSREIADGLELGGADEA